MRKLISYIILGLALVAFAFIYIKTQSFVTAIVVSGIGLAWFLFENVFELLSLFGKISSNDSSYIEQNKKMLKKKLGDNISF